MAMVTYTIAFSDDSSCTHLDPGGDSIEEVERTIRAMFGTSRIKSISLGLDAGCVTNYDSQHGVGNGGLVRMHL